MGKKKQNAQQKQQAPESQQQQSAPDLSVEDLQDQSLDGIAITLGNTAAAELLGVPAEEAQAFKSVDLEPDVQEAQKAAPAPQAEQGGDDEGDENAEDLGAYQAKKEEGGGEPDDKPDDSGGGGGGGGQPNDAAAADEGGGDSSGGGGDDGGGGGGGDGSEKGKVGGLDPSEIYERAKESTGNVPSDAVADPMRQFLNHDFSHVRLHYDSRAAALAKDLEVEAFTVGTHVFFASGQYRPNSPVGNVILAEQLGYVMLDDAMMARKSATGQMDMGKLNMREMMDGRLVGLDAVRKGSKISQKGGKSEDKKLKKEYNPLRAMGEEEPKKDTPRALDSAALIFPSQAYGKPKLARSIDPTGGKRLKDAGVSMGGVGQQLEKMLGGGGGKLDGSLEKLSTKALFGLGQQIFGQEIEEMPREMLASQAVKIAQTANPGQLPYKKELEAQFGVNLDNVQVFFGGKAKEACAMVQAKAFAVKNVIVFADASPNKELVTHEVTHVVQQGGHKKGNKLQGVPDKLQMTRPGDHEENEAENVAGDRSSGHSVKEGSAGTGVARVVDVSMTQKEVMSAVVDNVIPDGYSSNIGTFIAEGDGIQGVIDGVKSTINVQSAFPVTEVSTLFGGDAFSYLDPTAFMESIKPSGDTIVEQFATGVMGFCDATLGVLDGLLDTITGILDLVETFVTLLENASKVLKIISAALYAIAVALAATVWGAGAAALFFNLANTTKNIGNVIGNIAKTVRGFLDPIKKVIDVLEKVREVVQKIRDIAEIVKMGCDVFDWLTADTAEDREAASQDLAGSIGSMSNVLGMFTGGIYNEFATSFWNNAQPIVVGQLQGANGAAQTNIPGTQHNTPLNNAFSQPAHAAIPGGITAHGTSSAVEGDKGSKPDEAVGSYRQIRAEERKKHPKKDDEKEPPDLSQQVRSDTQSGANGARPAADAAGAPAPGAAPRASAPSGTGSIVSGATGIVSNTLSMGLGGDVMQNLAVATGAKFLEQSGYPTSVDELFDYINNVMTEKETAESLDTQAQQRRQEAVSQEQNADEAIVAMKESKKVSEGQEESSAKNEAAGHEGVGFMDYIMNLSANVQAKMEEKIDEAFGVNSDSDKAGNDGLFNAKGAESGADSGQSKGFGALGIIKRVATAALKAVLGKILEKIDIGKILQKIIPDDLGNIFELVTQFVQMAVAGKDQAKAKEEEARGAQSVLQGQISRDQAAQSESQANQATADRTIAEAEAVKASAQQSQAQADQQQAAARQLRQSLDQEQARLEQGAQTKMSEAGPLRPRNAVDQVQAPSGYDNLGTNPAAGDIGSMPGAPATLPLSADQGNPNPVTGPTRSGSLGMTTQTPWADGSVTEAKGASLTERQDASRGTDGTTGTSGQSDAFGLSPQTSFDPAAAFEGGPGGASGPGGMESEQLADFRSLTPDNDAVQAVTDARRPDPNIPPPIQAQVEEIQTPVVQGVQTQEGERNDALVASYEGIPEVEALYDTLEQLPEPSPDNTAYTQLRPISTGGLGYNSQHVIIDSDVAQVQSWGSQLPTDSHLTDPPAHGPIGEVPRFRQPGVSQAPASRQSELPGLQLPQIEAVEAPFEPVSFAMRDNPRAMSAASDVMDSVVVQAALSDSLTKAGGIVDAHESEEATLLDQAHTGVMQIQLDHEMQAADAWTTRDTELRSTRQDWVTQQQQTVDSHEQQISATEAQMYQSADDSMQSGMDTANSTLRAGEDQALQIESKADQDSQQLNSEAQAKAISLWGWFRQHVAEFSANVTDMMHGLWTQASSAIHSVLHGAEVGAKELISGARNVAANTLAMLSEQMSGLYGSMKSQLGDIGMAATERILAAVDAAYAMIGRVADEASQAASALLQQVESAIQSLTERTRSALEAEWAEFDHAAQEVRDARAQFPSDVRGADALTDGDDGVDTSAAEVSLRGGSGSGGSGLGPVSNDPTQRSDQVESSATPAALAGDQGAQVMSSWVQSPVSDRAEQWSTLGGQVDAAETAHDASFRAGLDPLHARLAGEQQGFQGGVTVNGPAGRAVDGVADGAMPELGMRDTQQPDLAGLNPSRALNLPDIDIDNPDLVPRASEVAGSLNEIQVSNPGLVTSPGPAPQIPLAGPTDPVHIDRTGAAGLQGGTDAALEARATLEASPGPEVVVPGHLEQDFQIDPSPYAPLGELDAVPMMDMWVQTGMDQPWRSEADAFYGPDHMSALSGLGNQALDAANERDQRRQDVLDSHVAEGDAMNEQLQREQLDAVNRERANIRQARADAAQQQNDAFSSFSQELVGEQRRIRGEVDTRVERDQRIVNDAFRQAEVDSERTVTEAERQAEAEKRRAEREADSGSWWERAASWVRSQVDRVKNLVNGIFDRARQAVTRILTTARDLAQRTIQAAFDFVRESIQTFVRAVQEKLRHFVSDVMPAILEALGELVEEAIALAQAVVERVKERVFGFFADLSQRALKALDDVGSWLQQWWDVALLDAKRILTELFSPMPEKLMEMALLPMNIALWPFKQFVEFIGGLYKRFNVGAIELPNINPYRRDLQGTGSTPPNAGTLPEVDRRPTREVVQPGFDGVPLSQVGQFSTKPVDGLVDYYMEQNWDSETYQAAAREMEVEGSVVAAMDRFMPEQASSEVRNAANLAWNISMGFVDAALIGAVKSIPGVGIVYMTLESIKDAGKAFDTYSNLEDGTLLALQLIRTGADYLGGVVSNIGDLASLVEDGSLAAVALTLGISGGAAAVAGLIAMITSGVSVVTDGIKVVCDEVIVVHSLMMMNEARRAGDFRKADAYRGIATSGAVDLVVDAIALAASAVDLAMLGAGFDGAAENFLEEIGKGALRGTKGLEEMLVPKILSGGAGFDVGGEQLGKNLGEWLPQDWFKTLAGPASRVFKSVADPMTATAGPNGLLGGGFVDPGEVDITGAGGDVLRGARSQSDTYFTEIYESVKGDDPRFTQQAVNEAIDPPDMTLLQAYESLLKPSFYLTTIRDLLIGGVDVQADSNASTGAQMLDMLADVLVGLEPFVQKINETMSSQFGAGLDEMLAQLAENMRQHEISLQFARDSITTVEDFMQLLRDLGNEGGAIDSIMEGVREELVGMKTSPEAMGLPEWAPQWMFDWAIEIFNGFLDQMAGGVDWIDDTFRPILDEFVDMQMDKAQVHLDDIAEVLREGGEVEVFLQAAHDKVMEATATFADAASRWVDGDYKDEATALRDRADQLRQERLENRVERFRAWVATYGQGQVDAWKGVHGDNVEEGYRPRVPQWEIDAVNQVHGMVMDRCDELEDEAALFQVHNDRYRSMADEDKEACDGLAGGQGLGNLEQFWFHADRLAEVAAAVGL